MSATTLDVILDRVRSICVELPFEYFETDLLSNLRRSVENSLEEGRITFEESAQIYRRYENGLHGYTYLEGPQEGR